MGDAADMAREYEEFSYYSIDTIIDHVWARELKNNNIWTTKEGKKLLLTNMKLNHLERVYKMLIRQNFNQEAKIIKQEIDFRNK
jgi:hypothetical protein